MLVTGREQEMFFISHCAYTRYLPDDIVVHVELKRKSLAVRKSRFGVAGPGFHISWALFDGGASEAWRFALFVANNPEVSYEEPSPAVVVDYF